MQHTDAATHIGNAARPIARHQQRYVWGRKGCWQLCLLPLPCARFRFLPQNGCHMSKKQQQQKKKKKKERRKKKKKKKKERKKKKKKKNVSKHKTAGHVILLSLSLFLNRQYRKTVMFVRWRGGGATVTSGTTKALTTRRAAADARGKQQRAHTCNAAAANTCAMRCGCVSCFRPREVWVGWQRQRAIGAAKSGVPIGDTVVAGKCYPSKLSC